MLELIGSQIGCVDKRLLSIERIVVIIGALLWNTVLFNTVVFKQRTCDGGKLLFCWHCDAEMILAIATEVAGTCL